MTPDGRHAAPDPTAGHTTTTSRPAGAAKHAAPWITVPATAPRTSALGQWAALTERTLWIMITKGELLVAVIIPLVFTLSFYLPLKYVMNVRGDIDYAQFVMPIIVLQSLGFTAMSAAVRSATEALTGFTTRLQTMPVAPLAPLGARMASATVRLLVATGASIGYGYLIGFRFADLRAAVTFVLFALAVGLVLTLGADALGNLTKSPRAVSQAITLPYLILGMLSSGFSPEDGFPVWIRPFVRNQPISHFSYVMRDLAAGGVSSAVLLPALAWLIGLGVTLVPLAVWAGTRRQ